MFKRRTWLWSIVFVRVSVIRQKRPSLFRRYILFTISRCRFYQPISHSKDIMPYSQGTYSAVRTNLWKADKRSFQKDFKGISCMSCDFNRMICTRVVVFSGPSNTDSKMRMSAASQGHVRWHVSRARKPSHAHNSLRRMHHCTPIDIRSC